MPRLRTIAALLCLAGCAGASALWARRALWADVLAFSTPAGHWQAIGSTRAGLVVLVSAVPAGTGWGGGVRAVSVGALDVEAAYQAVFNPASVRNSLGGFTLASGTMPIGSATPRYHALLVPHWAVAVPLALPPILWVRGVWRRRRWARQGRCRRCGYDLRGTPGRCPECGAPAGRPGAATPTTAADGPSDAGHPKPSAASVAEPEPLHRGGPMRRVALRLGIVAVAAAGVGGALAALDRRVAARLGDGADVLGVYDAGDLAGAMFWPPGGEAVRIAREPDPADEWPNGLTFPHVVDRRPGRLWDLGEVAHDLPVPGSAEAPRAGARSASAAPSAGRHPGLYLGDQIVIAAPPALHAQYAQLLAAVRVPAGAAFLTVLAGESAPPAGPGVQDAEAKLDAVLPEVRLDGVTLEAALDQIAAAARANLVVDWPALEESGVARTAPVKLRLWDLPLSRVLSVVLASVSEGEGHLACRAEEGLIRVTTRDVLDNSNVSLRIYDVRRLLENVMASERKLHANDGPPRSEGVISSSSSGPNVPSTGPGVTEWEQAQYVADTVDQLLRLLQEAIDPDLWRDNGGPSASVHAWAGRLFVQHTPEGHRKVERLLKTLSDEFAKE